jgi:hypothetical protein
VSDLCIMSPAQQKRLLDAVARGLAVVCLVAVIFAIFKLFNGADTPFLAFSVIGAAVVHLTNRPRPVEIAFTVLLACVLAFVYTRSGGIVGHFFAGDVVAVLAFLGLSSTLVLGWKAFRSTSALSALLLASFCPVLLIFTNVALVATIRFQPRIFDLFLFRFDGLFGVQPSFLVGQWFAASPMLQNTCFLVYAALPLAEVLVFVLYVRGNRMPINPLVAFVVAGVAGFVFYQVCPATGQIHIFGGEFPLYPPPNSLPLQTMRLDDMPRNAIPSLHSAWALLLWWAVRYCHRWMRCVATAFLILTLLATLGLGEHYLIDLAVAVPFTATVLAICARQVSRALASGGLTLGWLLYLRFGLPAATPSPLQAWIAVLATLAVSVLLWGARFRSLPTRRLQIPESSGIPSVDIAE